MISVFRVNFTVSFFCYFLPFSILLICSMSDEGRKRKRKRSSRPAGPALPNSTAGLSGQRQGREAPLPGSSREHVVLSDDVETTFSKRSTPGTVSFLPRNDNSRRSPQPGTSHHVFEPREAHRAQRSAVGLQPVPTPQVMPTDNTTDHNNEALFAALAALPPADYELVALVFVLLGILLTSDGKYDFGLLEDAIFNTGDHRPATGIATPLARQPVGQQVPHINDNLASNLHYGLPTMLFNPVNKTEDGDCRICLAQHMQGEELMVLPCLHRFHSSCVLQWLRENPICPLCRNRI
ncbi:hypothetical protein ACEWY4_014478 [Coilia grayii]|uniref:RING-type domain-containing protein n=1 Tax=Coilia grayii TaxID=363190 RepID=A0ABD1JSE4_9TELE